MHVILRTQDGAPYLHLITDNSADLTRVAEEYAAQTHSQTVSEEGHVALYLSTQGWFGRPTLTHLCDFYILPLDALYRAYFDAKLAIPPLEPNTEPEFRASFVDDLADPLSVDSYSAASDSDESNESETESVDSPSSLGTSENSKGLWEPVSDLDESTYTDGHDSFAPDLTGFTEQTPLIQIEPTMTSQINNDPMERYLDGLCDDMIFARNFEYYSISEDLRNSRN